MQTLTVIYGACWVVSLVAGIFMFLSVTVKEQLLDIPARVIYVMWVFLLACVLSPITGLFAFLVIEDVIHIKFLDSYLDAIKK